MKKKVTKKATLLPPDTILYVDKVTMSLYRLCELNTLDLSVKVLAADLPNIIYATYLQHMNHRGYSGL